MWDRARGITRGNYSGLGLRRVVRLLSAKCDSKQVFAERERKKKTGKSKYLAYAFREM